MPVGLVRVIGTGTPEDPFRPDVDSSDYSVIDLRPDATVASGFMIASADSISNAVVLLADDVNDTRNMTPRTRNALGNALGVTVASSVLPDMLLELLTTHASDTRLDRWNALRPTRSRWQIHLGHQRLVDLRVVSGGASATDSFGRADSTSLGADWTERLYDVQIVSNAVRPVGTEAAFRHVTWNTAFNTSDHRVQVNTRFNTNAGHGGGGVIMRGDAAGTSLDGYIGGHQGGGGGAIFGIWKSVGGTETNLSQDTSDGRTTGTWYTVNGYCIGSTIICRSTAPTASEQVVTDTSITSGTTVGFVVYAIVSNSRGEVDDWSAWDFSASPQPLILPSAAARRASGW